MSPTSVALANARYTCTIPMLLQNTGATVLFPPAHLVLDDKEPLILILITFFYLPCYLKCFISRRELPLWLFLRIYVVSNYVPYILESPITSFNRSFFVEFWKKNPHITSFSTTVEKLVVEEDYDARTYGPIRFQD